MNESTTRLLIGLSISLPLSTGIALLTWSLNSNSPQAFYASIGISYILMMLALMSFITIRKLFQIEDRDYNKKKIEIILSSLKYLDGNKPVYPNDNSEIDLDELEFNYIPNSNKNNYPNHQPQI